MESDRKWALTCAAIVVLQAGTVSAAGIEPWICERVHLSGETQAYCDRIAGLSGNELARATAEENARRRGTTSSTDSGREEAPQLIVDPYGEAVFRDMQPAELDRLEVAILSPGFRSWRVLRNSTVPEISAGDRSVRAFLLDESWVRDLNDDGFRDYLVTIDLQRARDSHQSSTGLFPDTLLIRYISSSRLASIFGQSSSGTGAEHQRHYASLEATAPLTVAVGDAADACHTNNNDLSVPQSVTCTYSASQDSLNLPDVVESVNQQINQIGFEIADDASTVIEATSGTGPPKRNYHCSPSSCLLSTTCANGGPGARGYAATAAPLTAFSTPIHVYVGEDGTGSSFAGGSATIVSKSTLDSVAVGQISDPVSAGIQAIAGGGGSGGGSNCYCSSAGAPTISCNNGTDGYAGGSAPLSIAANTSASGGGVANDSRQGGPGNADGSGQGGTGANNRSDRAGTTGIGGFGGIDQFTAPPNQSVFEDSSLTDWPFGAGGASQGTRGDASGGGGFGGGGGSGGTDTQHQGGAGGGGSWSLRATAASPSSPLIRGAAQSPQVSITFSVQAVPTAP